MRPEVTEHKIGSIRECVACGEPSVDDANYLSAYCARHIATLRSLVGKSVKDIPDENLRLCLNWHVSLVITALMGAKMPSGMASDLVGTALDCAEEIGRRGTKVEGPM